METREYILLVIAVLAYLISFWLGYYKGKNDY
jgi:hypothetical protein